MKYNLRNIMQQAWKLFRKYVELPFSECLHRAWLSAKAIVINLERIKKAKVAAGVTETTKTWSEWKSAGYEVIHGSKALFGCDLIWGSKGDNQIYKARFFGKSQVRAITQKMPLTRVPILQGASNQTNRRIKAQLTTL